MNMANMDSLVECWWGTLFQQGSWRPSSTAFARIIRRAFTRKVRSSLKNMGLMVMLRTFSWKTGGEGQWSTVWSWQKIQLPENQEGFELCQSFLIYPYLAFRIHQFWQSAVSSEFLWFTPCFWTNCCKTFSSSLGNRQVWGHTDHFESFFWESKVDIDDIDIHWLSVTVLVPCCRTGSGTIVMAWAAVAFWSSSALPGFPRLLGPVGGVFYRPNCGILRSSFPLMVLVVFLQRRGRWFQLPCTNRPSCTSVSLAATLLFQGVQHHNTS